MTAIDRSDHLVMQVAGPAAPAPSADRAEPGQRALRAFTAAMVALVLLGATGLLWVRWHQELAYAGEAGQRRADRLARELGQFHGVIAVAVAEAGARWRADPQAMRAAASDPQSAAAQQALLRSLPWPVRLQPVPAPTASAPTPQVGLPVVQEDGRRWLPVWRPSPGSADGLAGIVVWIDHDALRQRLGEDLHLPGSSASLFRMEPDGRTTLLARAPFSPEEIGRSLRGPLAEALAQSQAPRGVFDARTRLDQVLRRVAYTRVPDWDIPLVAVHGAAHEAVLAAWRQLAWQVGAVATALLAGIGWVGWRLDRQLGHSARQRRALAQREAENRRLADALAERVQERTDQLAASEQRYRMIFEAAPVAIGEEDWSGALALLRGLRARGISDGPAYFAEHPGFVRDCLRAVRMVSANPAAQALIARHAPLPAADGLQGLEAFYPDEQTLPLFIDELSALWRGDRHYADKRSIPSRDGPPMQLMLTVALPSIDADHGTAMACLVDIGELDRLNAELDRSVARLRRVNQELETFTYSVSHDLKAPLRGIDGYSRLLMTEHRDRLDDEGREFLGRIRQATQHMGTLIDDLLAYSRLERHALQLGPLPLAPLVRRVLAGCEADRRAAGAELSLELPEDLAVLADDQGLTMALRNLVDNALKFSRGRQPPKLTLRARRGGLGVQLSVDDNGVGFDMKYHDRIFTIFQRLQRAEDYPGTGIGLAIVRKAVERMGGQVRAHSAPDQGACFTIELPAAPAGAVRPADPATT